MDVVVSQWIAAPPSKVAKVMFEPFNDPFWIGGVRRAERLHPGPMEVGTRVRRHGGFLGRSLTWTTEVTALEPGRRLEMRFLDGPMTGTVAYETRPEGEGSRVSVRNHANAGFELPGMGWLVRLNVAADLKRLKRVVLEG